MLSLLISMPMFGTIVLEDAGRVCTLALAGCVWHVAQIQSLNCILLCIAFAGRGVIRQTLQGGYRCLWHNQLPLVSKWFFATATSGLALHPAMLHIGYWQSKHVLCCLQIKPKPFQIKAKPAKIKSRTAQISKYQANSDRHHQLADLDEHTIFAGHFHTIADRK